ncbi:MAG: hypothetical protein H0U74_12555 [Bradymonadaceae bacterium]|nr:hypothetical protein [Lujinxingiaceae bacterium]
MTPYELASLLELRERQRDDAELTYASEMAELERHRRAVAELDRRLERAQSERAARCAAFDAQLSEQSLPLVEVHRFDAWIDGLKLDEQQLRDELTQARDDERAQRTALERAHVALHEATLQLKAVEKHHESWLSEQKLLAQRKQSDALDDIAARIWREHNP